MSLHLLICKFCNKEFYAKKKEINRGRKFCSSECAVKSRDKGIRSTKKTKIYKSPPIYVQFSHIKSRAKRKNVPCDSKDNLLRWYYTTDRVCEYCQIPEATFVKLYGDAHSKFCHRLEIDKKVPKIGYMVGNIVFSCRSCNTVKSDILTYEEMKEIGTSYIKPKWQSKLSLNEMETSDGWRNATSPQHAAACA